MRCTSRRRRLHINTSNRKTAQSVRGRRLGYGQWSLSDDRTARLLSGAARDLCGTDQALVYERQPNGRSQPGLYVRAAYAGDHRADDRGAPAADDRAIRRSHGLRFRRGLSDARPARLCARGLCTAHRDVRRAPETGGLGGGRQCLQTQRRSGSNRGRIARNQARPSGSSTARLWHQADSPSQCARPRIALDRRQYGVEFCCSEGGPQWQLYQRGSRVCGSDQRNDSGANFAFANLCAVEPYGSSSGNAAFNHAHPEVRA